MEHIKCLHFSLKALHQFEEEYKILRESRNYHTDAYVIDGNTKH